ncbi:MAG: class I SAM-dependent methyltransferase [Reyranellaceae bacterium]
MLECPVCSNTASWPLVTLADLPMVPCRYTDTRSQALAAERGTLALCLCAGCGHVYNQSFEPDRMHYDPAYDSDLGFSARFRDYRARLVRRLVDAHGLREKSIIEIGCGHGDFLSELCRAGANRGVGYEPSQPGRDFAAGEGHVTVLPEPLVAARAEPADFVCAQHVLEHLPDVVATLREARGVLKDNGAVYFEVPNGAARLRRRFVWDIAYEHVSYFSPTSLAHALSDAGLAVSRLGTAFGDQYLQAEGGPARSSPSKHPSEALRVAWREADEMRHGFADRLQGVLGYWRRRLDRALGEGRVVLWGAGAKAVSFLSLLRIGTDEVEYVVDINPRKVDRFVPGTGQRIIAPEALADHRPTGVFVMNPQYLEEIRAQLASLGIACDLVPVDEVPTAQ